jgi:hypothetical protein
MSSFRLYSLLQDLVLPMDHSGTLRHTEPTEAEANSFAGIKNLEKSQRHSAMSDRHTVVSSIYSASFLFNWYRPVSPFPQKYFIFTISLQQPTDNGSKALENDISRYVTEIWMTIHANGRQSVPRFNSALWALDVQQQTS